MLVEFPSKTDPNSGLKNNNGQLTDNVWPEWRFYCPKISLVGHVDRSHKGTNSQLCTIQLPPQIQNHKRIS